MRAICHLAREYRLSDYRQCRQLRAQISVDKPSTVSPTLRAALVTCICHTLRAKIKNMRTLKVEYNFISHNICIKIYDLKIKDKYETQYLEI